MDEAIKKINNYKGFEIIQRFDGFEVSPGTLTSIASFIVRKDDTVAGFAFAVGMLDFMANPTLTNEALLEKANKIITKYVDKDIKHLEEYTFEYNTSDFFPIENPKWWNKTLEKLYG